MRLRAIPLGTSAGRPTLLRGASALALVAEASWTLCDCGEGAQLAAQRAGLSLSRLDAVLITHLHGDHFNGLPGLLGSLGLDGRERPLLVAGPKGIAATLEALGRVGALGLGDMPVTVVELDGPGGVLEWEHGYSDWVLRAAPLDHRAPTFGYRIALPDRPGALDVEKADAAGVPRGPLLAALKAGQAVLLADGREITPAGLVGPTQPGPSVAYTLDTVPCPGSVSLGAGADLLVHEATYEHARAELARTRGHSSGVEAARVAVQAGARKLLLTHFSPSAPVEQVVDEARAVFAEVVAATDGVPVELGR
jgi:ribonuclease Z